MGGVDSGRSPRLGWILRYVRFWRVGKRKMGMLRGFKGEVEGYVRGKGRLKGTRECNTNVTLYIFLPTLTKPPL